MVKVEKKWDLFISHSSSDKLNFVRPLVDSLRKKNLRIWYDEDSIEIGDSISEAIDNGLKESKFGLVVLSKDFISGKWTKNELFSLFSLEDSAYNRVLPILHEITTKELEDFSSLLADRAYLRSDIGLELICDKICAKVGSWGRIEAQKTINDFDIENNPAIHEIQKYISGEKELKYQYNYNPVKTCEKEWFSKALNDLEGSSVGEKVLKKTKVYNIWGSEASCGSCGSFALSHFGSFFGLDGNVVVLFCVSCGIMQSYCSEP